MLFDISTMQPVSIPDWAEQQMREDFPEFFKGKPVKIRLIPSKGVKKMMVPSNAHDSEARVRLEAPKSNSRKARGIVIDPETGEQYHIQYSTSSPRPGRNGVEFFYPGNNVTISDGMTIQSGQKDLLFYVHYLCPVIKGNKCRFRSSDPWYEYYQPEVEAAVKIKQAKERVDLEKLIYFDTPYDVILKAIDGLAMKRMGNEERDRVALRDAISKGSATFKSNAFSIINASVQTQKEKTQESTSEESEGELVNRLLMEKIIKNDEGKWYLRDKRGDGDKWLKNPFYETQGQVSEAFFELVDHLKINSELLNKLRKQ